MWIGSEHGLVCHDPAAKSYELYNTDPLNPRRIMGDRLRFIFEQRDGVIRVSTISGHSAIDRSKNQITNYSLNTPGAIPLSKYFVLSYFEDDTYSWFGTMGGLFRQDRTTQNFKQYGIAAGLPHDVVYGILPDGQGRLWMSTNKGLCCFDLASHTFRNFNISDGLQANEFNNSAYYKARSGELFFGGVNGFNRFFPAAISDELNAVPLFFTNAPRGLLTIPYSASHFSIDFVALEYSHPLKIQYAYKLEGIDSEWVNCGNRRSANYRHVPSGEYIFRVKSTNKDGVWCNNEISITVRVEQAQWLLTLNPEGGDKDGELKQYIEKMRSENLALQAANIALKSDNQRLLSSIYHDALTGIYNRAGYKHYLDILSAAA